MWDANKDRIVYEGNLLKFTQPVEGGTNLLDRLLGTTGCELVEASPYDRIWGVGFKAAEAEKNRDAWGLNLLGLALMKAREELTHVGAKAEANTTH